MSEAQKAKKVFGVRHGQTCILLVTTIVCYTLRMNLSMAIVSMTDTSKSNFQKKVFNWTSGQKGVLLSMFFYGYIVSNPPLGIMANRLPTRYLLTACVLISGLLNVLFPTVAFQTGYAGCCVFRAFLGGIQGLLVPCISSHLAKWAVPDERAPFLAFVLAGAPAGSAAVSLLAGYLADGSGGWPSIFYASGSIAILWSPVIFWLIRDSPGEYGGISLDEKNFIESHLVTPAHNWRALPIPWVSILTSVPIWVVVFTGFCYCWGYWTVGTELPSYMKAAFNVDIKQNGIYSAIPYLGNFLGSTLGPIICKLITNRFKFPVNLNRKIWSSIGQYGLAACLAIVGFTQPSATVVIILLFFGELFGALSHMGHSCTPVDLSPNFASVLMGVVNGLSQIASLLTPTITGIILNGDGDGTPFEWSVVFVLSAGILTLGGTFFNLLGSSTVQPWNSPKSI